ncbi:hypothetical protein JCM19231_3135 [Vibrio ishigakensis]|uniref:Lipoprotein n=1 Tax=Vibrio ishigakensis TaxID=1481914 RepID=A0A0B8NS08_9VIBR|nr:hypothetical protein [Vibrio ishigakensis]GAM56716.1 hypothetical protein JCM19231_3135 [Vibrio ishigakensis]
MKKLNMALVAIGVATVLSGCNADDVKDDINNAIDQAKIEAELKLAQGPQESKEGMFQGCRIQVGTADEHPNNVSFSATNVEDKYLGNIGSFEGTTLVTDPSFCNDLGLNDKLHYVEIEYSRDDNGKVTSVQSSIRMWKDLLIAQEYDRGNQNVYRGKDNLGLVVLHHRLHHNEGAEFIIRGEGNHVRLGFNKIDKFDQSPRFGRADDSYKYSNYYKLPNTDALRALVSQDKALSSWPESLYNEVNDKINTASKS